MNQLTMKVDKFIPYVLKKHGDRMQVDVCIEEMAELTKEFSKYKRGNPDFEHIKEELADVELCIRQMCYMVDMGELEMEQRIQGKIDRYFDRHNEEEEHG